MMMSERVADWICVGSGAAGLGGALSAAALGGRVAVVEKGDRLGGATAYSYGSLWCGCNQLQIESGLQDNPEDVGRYIEYLSGGFGDPSRRRCLARDAAPTLAFYIANGIGFRLIRGLPDHYYPIGPGSLPEGRNLEVVPVPRLALGDLADAIEEAPYLPSGVSWSDAVAWGGFGRRHDWREADLEERRSQFAAGQGLVAQLLRRCIELSVEVLRSTVLDRLAIENGAVCGVWVRQGRREMLLRARRGVLLATGGYEGNQDLVRAFEAFPNSPNHFPEGVAGDGLMVAAEIGAAVSVMPLKLQVMLGYWTPREAGGHEFREAGINELTAPHTMVVNPQGRRFADESFFQAVQVRLRDFDVYRHRYVNLPCYLVFDAQFARRYAFAGQPPGSAIPDWVHRASTLDELSGKLGIDAAGLAETVESFNHAATLGKDPDFHRGELAWASRSMGDASMTGNPNLGTVAEPPFYGVELEPSGTAAGGLVADEWGRVRHVRGHVIPGLYAAGNVATCSEYGAGFQAGLTLMSGMLFGHRAGQHAFS